MKILDWFSLFIYRAFFYAPLMMLAIGFIGFITIIPFVLFLIIPVEIQIVVVALLYLFCLLSSYEKEIVIQ